ncbi:MAG: hypothetical protein QNJ47_24415 [Nostocaceae cyanobacterium]|nr:hypothetical protein [Nostocaceae cyanobacterium]
MTLERYFFNSLNQPLSVNYVTSFHKSAKLSKWKINCKSTYRDDLISIPEIFDLFCISQKVAQFNANSDRYSGFGFRTIKRESVKLGRVRMPIPLFWSE